MYVFSGQDGGYGLESEEVILTPEDENPLRRILQVHTLCFSPTISTIYLTPSIFICTYKHTHIHTWMHANKTERTHSATLPDLGSGNIVGLTLTRGKTSLPPTHMEPLWLKILWNFMLYQLIHTHWSSVSIATLFNILAFKCAWHCHTLHVLFSSAGLAQMPSNEMWQRY